MKNNENETKVDSFQQVLKIIIPGWTIGASTLMITSLIFLAPDLMFGENSIKDKLMFLSFFAITLITAFLQSILISLICYLGIKIYWLKRKDKITITNG